MTKKSVMCLVVSAMLVLCVFASAKADSTAWTVAGRTIQQNGQPFTVKGVNYSPAPIGSNPPVWVPFGDFFIPTWETIWQRDFTALRKMGANSIRLYFMYPYIKDSKYNNGAIADHSGFLNAAYNKGTEPVYVFAAYPVTNVVYQYKAVATIPPYPTWYYKDPATNIIYVVDEDYDEKIAAPRRLTTVTEYTLLAGQLASYPAVMGFVISNEANNSIARNHPAFWRWLDDLAKDVKTMAPGKLTLIALVDDAMESVSLAEQLHDKMPHIDIWGINSYRGSVSAGFDNLFSTFSAASEKPLLVTEYGCPASTRLDGAIVDLPNNAQDQADYVSVHWQDIVKNMDVCAGGYVFEWTDEWWKNGNVAAHDPGSATNPGFPGGWDDEEWFGINSVAVNNRPADDPWNPGQPNDPDIPGPRSVYDTLTGLWK